MAAAEVICYICSSDKFVDDHHYDCQEGKLSPDTVPLCRRCHRTYHDLGVEWFDDEYLDKAIEIENKRREIVGKLPMRRKDVVRSDYWNKIHNIAPKKKRGKLSGTGQLPLPLEPVRPGRIDNFLTRRLV